MLNISLLLFCCMFWCFNIVCMLTVLSVGRLVYMLVISEEHIRVSSLMFNLRKSVVRCSVFVIL
jgi:hypothetical protein